MILLITVLPQTLPQTGETWHNRHLLSLVLMKTPVSVLCPAPLREDLPDVLVNALNDVTAVPDWLDAEDTLPASLVLAVTRDGLELRDHRLKKPLTTRVDFVTGAKAHRRKFGGGKSQAIAKAVGVNKARGITVLDATAGMGGDAFVLATLGCSVRMCERSPTVRAMLADGLHRARMYSAEADAELFEILSRMELVAVDSLVHLQSDFSDVPQVVYLDPMFPARKKSAEVKKDMQLFHDLVGADADADGLLEPALALASHRVVVKRPKIAPFLAGQAPGYQLEGKAGRFDIYPLKAFAETAKTD